MSTSEENLAPLQYPGEGGYLLAHWDRYSTRPFRELCGLVSVLARTASANTTGKPKLRVVEFGSSSGTTFRALETYLGREFEFSFVGTDVDRLAVGFALGKFPAATIYEADTHRLSTIVKDTPFKADIAIVMSQLYSMPEEGAGALIETLAQVAPILVIADQIDAFADEAGGVRSLLDCTGRPYESNCHPFGRMFREAGYRDSLAVPVADAVKSFSGFMVAAKAGLPAREILEHALRESHLDGFGEARGANRAPFGPMLVNFLTRSKLNCVDVGAAGGVHELWRRYGQFIEVDAFEPNKDACDRAQVNSASFVRWHPLALGSKTGTQRFYVLNAPSGSSFYPPNDEVQQFFNDSHYRGIHKIVDIETVSFGDFLRMNRRQPPNLIKLDTQGSELDILRSLDDEHWRDIISIEVEVEFLELYKGQPLFSDVDAYLKSKGFLLFDLRTAREYCSVDDKTAYYRHHVLNFAVGSNSLGARLYAGDALYIQDFIARPPASRNRLLKLIGSLMIYSYFDYALYLCDVGESRGLISVDERRTLIAEVKDAAPEPEDWQRADQVGIDARAALAARNLDPNTYQAFWAVRTWPNQ